MAHVRCILFFSFWDIFYSFTPLIAPKSKLKKNEKISFFKDIINLQMCTKNYDYMMYSSWDMDRQTDESDISGIDSWVQSWFSWVEPGLSRKPSS